MQANIPYMDGMGKGTLKVTFLLVGNQDSTDSLLIFQQFQGVRFGIFPMELPLLNINKHQWSGWFQNRNDPCELLAAGVSYMAILYMQVRV